MLNLPISYAYFIAQCTYLFQVCIFVYTAHLNIYRYPSDNQHNKIQDNSELRNTKHTGKAISPASRK